MVKKTGKVLVFLMMAFLCVFSVKASEKPVIVLAGIEDYAPYSFTVNDQHTGIYVDLMTELFSRISYPIHIKLMPFNRVLHETRTGTVSAVFGAYWTSDRTTYATYVEEPHLATISVALFVSKGSWIQQATIENVTGAVIGYKMGFAMPVEYDAAVENDLFIKTEVRTAERLVKMLLAKRLDGFMHTIGQSQYYIEQLDKKQEIQQVSPLVFDERFTYLAFSNEALKTLPEELLPLITQALSTMVKDGTFASVYRKYNLSYVVEK